MEEDFVGDVVKSDDRSIGLSLQLTAFTEVVFKKSSEVVTASTEKRLVTQEVVTLY